MYLLTSNILKIHTDIKKNNKRFLKDDTWVTLKYLRSCLAYVAYECDPFIHVDFSVLTETCGQNGQHLNAHCGNVDTVEEKKAQGLVLVIG